MKKGVRVIHMDRNRYQNEFENKGEHQEEDREDHKGDQSTESEPGTEKSTRSHEIEEDIPPEEPPLEDFFQEEVEDKKTLRKKKSRKRWMKLGILLVSFLLIIQGATSLFQVFRPDVVDFLITSYELSQDEEVASWKESVVTLQVEQPGQSARGTGFFIEENGLMITNRHVVEDAFHVVASLHDGSAYEASIIGQSDEVDLAFLQIEADRSFPHLPLQPEGEGVNIGANITIIGNPLNFTGIANEGEVLEIGNPTAISAPTYRGNSGSPAINQEGEVLGVIFATRHRPSSQGGSVGLMVPVDEIWGHLP